MPAWRLPEVGAPMRIFMSYAEEDREVVSRLRRQLRDHTVYDWMDRSTTISQRIVRDIEQNLLDADAFFLVLSPNYHTSPWCDRERDMALHIDTERGARWPGFIHVLKIADVPDRDLGLLIADRHL